MPTTLPRRRSRRPDLFVVFLLVLTAAISIAEIAEPAPAQFESAAMVTSP